MQADGYSFDDKRTPLGGLSGAHRSSGVSLPDGSPALPEHAHNNIPDILSRWQKRDVELKRERTEQSFMVPKAEIAENGYDLSINRYKEIVYEEVQYDPPQQILKELKQLEDEIQEGLEELGRMLG